MVGAPVWPKGVTVSADAALAVTAVAANAAAPLINLRRLRGWSGKVSGVVMISSLGFLLGGNLVPAIRHKAGGLRETTSAGLNSFPVVARSRWRGLLPTTQSQCTPRPALGLQAKSRPS